MQESATFHSSNPTISEREVTITAEDGYRLAGTVFERAESFGTIVVNAATGAPQRYYAAFARFLARRGIRVVTYDYRGIGRSRPASLVGFSADMSAWARYDVQAAFRYARGLAPQAPLGFVGHSFGAQAIGLADELRTADVAVLFGGQFGYYGHWSGLSRVGLAALWHVGVPVLTSLYGYLPRRYGLPAELPSGVARQWARWCLSPDYLMSEDPMAASRFTAFHVPTLALSATDDRIAPRAASRALLDRLPSDVVRYRELQPERYGGPIGHFGFFRERFEETLWRDAAQFVEDVFEGREQPRDGAPVGHRGTNGDGSKAPSLSDIMADLSYGRS